MHMWASIRQAELIRFAWCSSIRTKTSAPDCRTDLMKHGRTQIVAALTLVVALWPLCGAARFISESWDQPPLSDAECKVAPVDKEHLFIAAGVMAGNTLAGI